MGVFLYGFLCDTASESNENFLSPIVHVEMVIEIFNPTWQQLNRQQLNRFHNILANQINYKSAN